MHRGSSKDGTGPPAPSENLPLSAPGPVHVTLEFTRGARRDIRELDVLPGTLLRTLLRTAGGTAEGSLVLAGERPVPLDTPIREAGRYIVVSTFSGG